MTGEPNNYIVNFASGIFILPMKLIFVLKWF